MERFYDDDEEPIFGSNDDDDIDDEDDDDDDEIEFIDQQGIIDVMHVDLAQIELNQHLLGKAIEIAQRSWFWRFKSHERKMDEIEKIYQRLLQITDNKPKEDK